CQMTLSPASTRGRSRSASRCRWKAASPKLTWSSWARLRKRCRSCSHVNPIPPCTWRADAMTRFDASEHQILAVEAATDASSWPAPMHHAAQYALERMPSTSTSMSAQRCFTAWKLPIGRPNCTRSFAYSTAMSIARDAPPSISAAVHAAPRAAPGDAADRVAAGQPLGPVVAPRPRQRAQREQRRQERRRRDVTPDLLDQHRHLDGAESQTTAVVRHLDRRPSLLDHRLPEPVVDPAAGIDDGADARRGRQAVEQLARAVTQRELVVRQLEIHARRRLPDRPMVPPPVGTLEG